MSGGAVIGVAGDTWNGLGGFAYSSYPDGATFTSGDLLYANGVNSGVTLTLSAPSGTYDANASGFGNHSPFSWTSLANENADIGYPATPYAVLMASCIVANSATANGIVTLSGLAPGGVYNLYTYNASDQNEAAGRTSTFTVNGVTKTSTYDGATTNLVNGVDYLEFAGVAASGAGTLTINFGDLIATESDFNGFQLELVGGVAPPPPPTVSTISPNGIILCTNTTLTCTATAGSNTININTVQAIVTTSTLGGTVLTTVTNNLKSPVVTGLGTSTATVNYPLTSNVIYSVTILATDSNGNSSFAKASFDTISPALVIEASDFNYGGGLFLDTPPNGGLSLYAGQVGQQTIDEQKASSAGATDNYRGVGDPIITQNASPNNGTPQKFVTAAANGDTNPLDVPQEVGYNSVGDWVDYTRTFGTGGSAPAGTYAIWARLCTQGSGPALNVFQVTNGQGTASQGTTPIGSFAFTDNNWNTYDYVPMLDAFGNLVSITLNGQETLRSQVAPGGNPNIGFYLLLPAVAKLTPSLLFAYPDGTHPFEPTNKFVFTVGPANGSNILSTGVHLVLNGVDVTGNPQFSITAGGTSWAATYPVLSNEVYAAVINVTNTAGVASTFSINFDTFNVTNFTWECADYDFSTNGTTGGLFIDNPVPSCDTTTPQVGEEATNSYFAYPEGLSLVAVALQNVDIYWPDTQPKANDYYRADGVGTEPSGDYVRPQFLAARTQFNDPNIGPFQIGYYDQYNWLNYTRVYPTNNYYLWGRLAGGAGPFSGTTLSMVTNGWGTPNQSTNVLGTFADPHAAGWESYHWIPLLDTNGNKVVVSLGGQATLKLTSGNNVNAAYLMLAPAPPSFQVTASVVGGNLNLAFPTAIGHSYTVVYKSSLTVSAWTPVGSAIAGNGSVMNLTESLSGTQGYYSVIVQ
jgi:hypothetical protein